MEPSQCCLSVDDGRPRMGEEESELRIMVKSMVLKIVKILCCDGGSGGGEGAEREKSEGNMLYPERLVGTGG